MNIVKIKLIRFRNNLNSYNNFPVYIIPNLPQFLRNHSIFKFHFKSIFAGITKMQYAINKKPCAYPIAIVASGISHMYFRGIAIPISNKNETPSRNPISLNLPILLVNKFTVLIYTVIYGLAFDFKFMLYFFN